MVAVEQKADQEEGEEERALGRPRLVTTARGGQDCGAWAAAVEVRPERKQRARPQQQVAEWQR